MNQTYNEGEGGLSKVQIGRKASSKKYIYSARKNVHTKFCWNDISIFAGMVRLHRHFYRNDTVIFTETTP